jgi:hypothetical protein
MVIRTTNVILLIPLLLTLPYFILLRGSSLRVYEQRFLAKKISPLLLVDMLAMKLHKYAT